MVSHIRCFVIVAAIVSTACHSFGTEKQPAPKGTIARTVYLDISALKEESPGNMTVSPGVGQVIADKLSELGFQSVFYRGAAPKEAKYFLSYSASWDRAKSGGPYIKRFTCVLKDQKKTIGTMGYTAPKLEKAGPIYREIENVLAGLLINVEHPVDVMPEEQAAKPLPHPSAMLLDFDFRACSALRAHLEATTYPIKCSELFEKLGGSGRLHKVYSSGKVEHGKTVGVIEYVLTNVAERFVFYLDFYVNGEPKDDGNDMVLATQLFLATPQAARFIPAPEELEIFSKNSNISGLISGQK
jgi:hypothetical protein